jgi:hypothetical protein
MCLYIHSIITYVPKHKKNLKLEMEISNFIFRNLLMYIEGLFVKFTYMIIKIFSCFFLFTLFHVNKYLKYLSFKF